MFASLRHCRRLIRAAFTLAHYDVALPTHLSDYIPPPARWAGRLARRFARPGGAAPGNASRLADALTALGPAYVKLGQFLATRPDILGPELAADLQVLQDKQPPFSMEAAKAAFAREAGKPVEAAFAAFSAPVAAASIAQVHKARLILPPPAHDPSTEEGAEAAAAEPAPEAWVAVKLLRPGVEKAFAEDMAAFAFAARMIERLRPSARRLEPVKLVETLAASVRLELDLRLEAAAASEIAEHMRPEDGFVVPEIHWPLTTRRLLTTDWIAGVPLGDFAALEAAGFDRKALARVLLCAFLSQSLRDGLFHADMHPGNLFAMPPAAEGAPPRIAAVDYGIVGRLDGKMQRFMAETLYGFITRDYVRIARVHFEVGFVGGVHRPAEFAQALRAIGEPVFGRPVSEISMARLLAQLFEVTRLFDMHLQPQLVLLQKTMVVVEGVARALDPELDMWETSRPVVEAWMSRELGPEARLQEAAGAAVSLVRIAARAPEVLEKLEVAAGQMAALAQEGGVRLHPETARAIAAEEARATRGGRYALWAAAAALAMMALASLG